MIKTEQKILTWSRHNIDYIGTQLKTYLDSMCTNGWYVHQILPTIEDVGHNKTLLIKNTKI